MLPRSGACSALDSLSADETTPCQKQGNASTANELRPTAPSRDAPPPYSAADSGAILGPDLPLHKDTPRSFERAASLPTYEEAREAGLGSAEPVYGGGGGRGGPEDAGSPACGNAEDGLFVSALVLVLLFNWIGFWLLLCLTDGVAARCGAICGFGLCLIKWILVIRWSSDATGSYFRGQYWLWWMFLLLGLLLFVVGLKNYIKSRESRTLFVAQQ